MRKRKNDPKPNPRTVYGTGTGQIRPTQATQGGGGGGGGGGGEFSYHCITPALFTLGPHGLRCSNTTCINYIKTHSALSMSHIHVSEVHRVTVYNVQ